MCLIDANNILNVGVALRRLVFVALLFTENIEMTELVLCNSDKPSFSQFARNEYIPLL